MGFFARSFKRTTEVSTARFIAVIHLYGAGINLLKIKVKNAYSGASSDIETVNSSVYNPRIASVDGN